MAFYPQYFSRCVAVYATHRANFNATDSAGAFNDQFLWISTASTAPLLSAKTSPSPLRTRGTATSPFQTNYCVLSDHRPSPALLPLLRECHDTITSGVEHLTGPFALSIFIGPFLEPLHHPFPQRSWPIKTIVQPANGTISHNATYEFASLQRHATGSLARGISSHSGSPLFFGPRCRR